MRKLIPACLALAALSLLLPSVPTYDPWSWIVWGREVAHLDLDTTGGPSWKPLPVMFTSVFSVTGAIDDSIPPLLWLVVARAGALLALALVFRLARRLAGPGWQGVAAGLVAAVALAFTPQWLRYAAHGNEAPLAVAAMLWAVERHLDGSRRAAVALGLVACLMRPEVFPFLALYCAWAWRAEPATRRVIVAGAVVLPVLWLIPEWIGSGQPLGAGAQARSEPSWSLSRLDHPWLELLSRAHETLGPALEAGVAAALVLAWRARDRAVLALGGVAVAWVALVALMTQSGFSGNARYLLPATVIACLLTGVALGRAAADRRAAPCRPRSPAVALGGGDGVRGHRPGPRARTPGANGGAHRAARPRAGHRGRPHGRRRRRRGPRRARGGPRVRAADGVADHAPDRPGRAPLAPPGAGVRRRPARPGHAGGPVHARAGAGRQARGRPVEGLRAAAQPVSMSSTR